MSTKARTTRSPAVRRSPAEALLTRAVKDGIIKERDLPLYGRMMKHDPVATRRLLVKLRQL